MSDFLHLDKKNNYTFTESDSEEEICKKIELKLPENRIKKVIDFLNDKTNEYLNVRSVRPTRKVIAENMLMVSFPAIFLYLPHYYMRIFLKIGLLSSRKNDKSFGYCMLTTTEFYLILSDLDRVFFKKVFKFLIKSGIIKVKDSGAFKINRPYSYGVFGFDLRTLTLVENTQNKFQNRIFKAKSKFTFVTDFEKI